jgi:hypothetical protein
MSQRERFTVQNIIRFSNGARIAAAVMALFFGATEVNASAINVSAGDTVVFTFDFTTLSSARPPYPDVRVYTGIDLDSIDSGIDRCRYTLYRDANAIDPDTSVVACGIGTFEGGTEDSGWLDGIFSIALTVLSGEVTLDPHAIAFSAFGPNGEPITPWVIPHVRIVAEPAHAAFVLVFAVAVFRSVRVRARSASG